MTVVLNQITKSFGAAKVLHELDLEVHDGEFLVLLGASGSGKSTALRMIAGLESVTGGTISIDGRDVTNELPKNRNVAVIDDGGGRAGLSAADVLLDSNHVTIIKVKNHFSSE